MSRPTLEVSEETTSHGQTNMDVHIRQGGRLTQHGQINGDVTVDRGGVLEQHGQVNGSIHAHGKVILWGQVNGEIHAYSGCDFLIAEGVTLGSERKRYLAPDGRFRPVPKGGVFIAEAGPAIWRLNPDGQLSPT